MDDEYMRDQEIPGGGLHNLKLMKVVTRASLANMAQNRVSCKRIIEELCTWKECSRLHK